MDINGDPYGAPTGSPAGTPNGALTPVSRPEAGRRRRLALAIAGGAFVSLVGFGAVATTFAADPSPSPSAGTEATPAPNRSKSGTGSHRGGARGDCPDKGERGGNGGSGGGTTPQTPESPSPSESPSDVPESL